MMNDQVKEAKNSGIPRDESQAPSELSAEFPRPALDAELYAVALCVEGLDPLTNNPRSLFRVINFIGSRYLDNLKEQRDRLDAEIKVLNERVARKKYDELEAQRTSAASGEHGPTQPQSGEDLK